VRLFGRRKSIPKLDELLPEEERKLEGLIEASQSIPWEDDSEDIDTGLLIELYEEAVRKQPHEFIYHYLLGTAYFSSGEMAKAKEILERASSLKPDDPRPLYNLGVIYYGIWDARNEEQNGRTTDEQKYRWVREALNDPFLPDDLRRSGENLVREFQDMMRHPDYERIKRLRDFYCAISMSRDTAAANALHYFRKVLACQLHPEDRKAVEQHIKLIKQREALR
jgi:tetratricopeptide (TPR) repeat protein